MALPVPVKKAVVIAGALSTIGAGAAVVKSAWTAAKESGAAEQKRQSWEKTVEADLQHHGERLDKLDNVPVTLQRIQDAQGRQEDTMKEIRDELKDIRRKHR